jgi:hypothetical protein
MGHDIVVEQLLARRQCFIENILQAPDLHGVAAASLAIFEQVYHVARDILQAKITLEAQQHRRADIKPCCLEAGVTSVHTRPVGPETLCGEITIPVRTFRCRGCRAWFRPDDGPLGVPESGAFTDDVRYRYAPVAAELPHRVANALFARCTGVRLSSCGGEGTIDSTAADLQTWQAEREPREADAVGEAVALGNGDAERRVEIAIDGVMAHIDGRWQEATVDTILARRYVAVLCSAEGACKPVIQSRFKRAGMRWKQSGFLNVLVLHLASLSDTFEAFWASRGLAVQTSAAPTK